MSASSATMTRLVSQPASANACGIASAPVPTIKLKTNTSPTWQHTAMTVYVRVRTCMRYYGLRVQTLNIYCSVASHLSVNKWAGLCARRTWTTCANGTRNIYRFTYRGWVRLAIYRCRVLSLCTYHWWVWLETYRRWVRLSRIRSVSHLYSFIASLHYKQKEIVFNVRVSVCFPGCVTQSNEMVSASSVVCSNFHGNY